MNRFSHGKCGCHAAQIQRLSSSALTNCFALEYLNYWISILNIFIYYLYYSIFILCSKILLLILVTFSFDKGIDIIALSSLTHEYNQTGSSKFRSYLFIFADYPSQFSRLCHLDKPVIQEIPKKENLGHFSWKRFHLYDEFCCSAKA